VEPPTGTQFEIRHGEQRAVVVEVGAGLREYEVDAHAVLDGFALDAMPDGGRGQPLLPWPNRLADGRYDFNGRSNQLPIDEVGRNNASHGLTRWLNWTLVSHTDSRVELQHTIHPRPGYPFTLGLRIVYALDANGLSVTTHAKNLGIEALPFGAGQHPYLTAGTPTVDTTLVRIPAGTRLELDAERRLPTGRQLSIDGTDLDFRELRHIGPTVLDECYTDLGRDDDGQVRVTLAASHTKLTVWMKAPYRYVQVFSGDTLAPERRRRGLAVEPMTCPPNALHTGIDVIVLAPEAAVELEWGITPEF
jgi:aldose 1-epimerase